MTATFERNGQGRPLIKVPGQDKPVAYTRATTFAGATEDASGLTKWKMRLVAQGLMENPYLVERVRRAESNWEIAKIADEAFLAAGGDKAARLGTLLHEATEAIDRGEPLGPLPEGVELADLQAYQRATKGWEHWFIEQPCVLDALKVAGTPDRVSMHLDTPLTIMDLKTGSIDYPHKIACQLAIYAHSRPYDPETGLRWHWTTQLAPDMDLNDQRGVIIHLPAGSGKCTLHWVDIKAGWEGVLLAEQVRAWRSRKGLTTPFPSAALQHAPEEVTA